MMSKINTSKITYILWSMLLGMASFLISGVMACMVILRLNNYILETIIAGGIGGLLLGLFLRMPQKIGRITIAGIIAVPIGIFTSFIMLKVFSRYFLHLVLILRILSFPILVPSS